MSKQTDKDDCYTCGHLSEDEGGNECCRFDDDCQAPNGFAKWEPKIEYKFNNGRGAVLCRVCRVIIDSHISHDEAAAKWVGKDLCEECRGRAYAHNNCADGTDTSSVCAGCDEADLCS